MSKQLIGTGQISLTKVSQGAPGESAKYITINGDQIFRYLDSEMLTIPEPRNITLQAKIFNINSSDVKWFCKKASSSEWTDITDRAISATALTGVSNLMVDPNDTYWEDATSLSFSCVVDGQYYDEITIIKLAAGESFNAILTNEAQTIPTNFDGSFNQSDLEDIFTDMKVFQGTKELSYNPSVDNLKMGQYSLEITESVGVSGVIDNQGRISLTYMSNSLDTGHLEITATIKIATDSKNDTKKISKIFSISKAKQGEEGEQGNPAQNVTITGENIFVVGSDIKKTITPEKITLTGIYRNLDTSTKGIWQYKTSSGSFVNISHKAGEAEISHSDSNYSTLTLYPNSLTLKTDTNLTVRLEKDGLYDDFSIVKLSETSNYTAILTNEAHTVSVDEVGAELEGELDKAYTDCVAYKNTEKLSAVSSKSALGDGKFYVEVYSITPNDSNTIITKTTDTRVSVKDTNPFISSISATIRFYMENASTYIDKVFSMSKSYTGKKGEDGEPAKLVLLNGPQVFKYSEGSQAPLPTSITLQSTVEGYDLPFRKWYVKKNSTTRSVWELLEAETASNVEDITIPYNDTRFWGENLEYKNISVKCEVADTYDEVSLIKVYDGENGEDSISILLTNENHTFPANSDGGVDEDITITTKVMAFKGTQSIVPTIGALPTVSGLSITSSGTTITITAKAGSNLAKSGSFNIPISYLGQNFTKTFSWSKSIAGLDGVSGYTILLTNENYTFNADSEGKIVESQSTTTEVVAYKGSQLLNVTIGTLPSISGLTLSKSGTTITIKANTGTSLANSGKFNVPIVVEGQTFNKVFSWTKVKDGHVGSDAEYVIVSGEQIFKYTNNFSGDPTPSSIILKATKMNTTKEGKWQYKNSNSEWIDWLTGGSVVTGTTLQVNPTSGILGNSKQMSIRYIIGEIYDEITIVKVSDGATGATGAAGKGVKSITEYYLVSTASTGITTSTSGWSTSIPTMTSTNRYLWNYEVIAYTDSSSTTSTPKVIGVYGNTGNTGATGATGNGIKSITNYYLVSSSNSGITVSTSGWTTTIQQTTTTNKYLWNYEVVAYTNGTNYTSTPIIIGTHGATGATGAAGKDAYTVLLTNESHTFPTANNGNIATALTATTQVIAYKGASSITPTIGTLPTVAGLTLSKSGTTITIQANTGTSLADSGYFSIPITVDGQSFTKNFSWTKAKAGATGATGPTGAAAKAVDIIASSQVFKSSDGGVTFSPSTITLTPKLQNLTYSSWQYSTNGGSSWNGFTTSITGWSVSSGVLTINKDCSLFTKTNTSVVFRVNTNDSSYYDVMTIVKLYDVSDIQIGGRNYIQFSDFKNRTSEWVQTKHTNNTGSSTVANGVMSITSSGSEWIQRQIYSNKTATALLNIQNNKKYTMSAEIMVDKASTGTATIDFRVNYKDGTTSNRIRLQQDLSKLTPGTWQKITSTAIVTYTESNFDYWRIIPQGVLNQTVHYRNLKLEDGALVTSWSPAPEDFEDPNTVPVKPVITSSVKGFGSITLNWTFENKSYYTYRLYGSKTSGFTPGTSTLLTETKSNFFLHQVVPGETWYYKVCAVNSYGTLSSYSDQLTVSTKKMDSSTIGSYIANAAIGSALIGTLSADNIGAGTITTAKLAASAVTADKIAAGTITADKLTIGLGKAGGYSRNPDFTDWSSTLPTGVSTWGSNAGTISKVAVDGKNVLQIANTAASSQAGVVLNNSFFATGIDLSGTQYICIEAKVRLTSGTSFNGSCILVDVYRTDGTYQRLQMNFNELGAATTNTWYTLRKIFKITDSNMAKTFKNVSGYALTNWSSAGTLTIKTMQFANINFYHATSQDYLTQTWTTGTEINGASIKTGTIKADSITSGTFQGTNFIAGGSTNGNGYIQVKDTSNNVKFYASKNGVYATNIQFPDSISSSGAVTTNSITTASGSGFTSSMSEKGTLYNINYYAQLTEGRLVVSSNGTFEGVNTSHSTYVSDSLINLDGTQLSKAGQNVLQITSNYGYVTIGAENDAWCHFKTNRPAFYFNKNISVDGQVRLYQSTNGRLGYDSSTTDVYISNNDNNWLRLKTDKTMTYAGYRVFMDNYACLRYGYAFRGTISDGTANRRIAQVASHGGVDLGDTSVATAICSKSQPTWWDGSTTRQIVYSQKDSGGYPMIMSDNHGWIRTPPSGLIPNTSGTGSGRSTIGSSTWRFSIGYFNEVHSNRFTFYTPYGTNWIGQGTGDGNDYTTYNIKFWTHNGLAFTDNGGSATVIVQGRQGRIMGKNAYYVNCSRSLKSDIRSVVSENDVATFTAKEGESLDTNISAETVCDFLDAIDVKTYVTDFKQEGATQECFDVEKGNSLTLGYIADDIAEHPLFKYIGEKTNDGLYAINSNSLTTTLIVGYKIEKQKRVEMEKRIRELEEKFDNILNLLNK